MKNFSYRKSSLLITRLRSLLILFNPHIFLNYLSFMARASSAAGLFFLFFSNISENRRFHYNRCHFDSWACLSITNLPWIGFSWFSFSLVFVVLRIGKYINFLFSQSVQSETSSKFNTVVIFFISERWFKFFYPSRYKMAGKMALHKRFWIFSPYEKVCLVFFTFK